jgi:hypothetical protein
VLCTYLIVCMINSNEMADDQKFSGIDELKTWLLARGALPEEADKASTILNAAGVTHAGEIIGLTKDDLKELGLPLLLANSLSKKLQYSQGSFYCALRLVFILLFVVVVEKRTNWCMCEEQRDEEAA